MSQASTSIKVDTISHSSSLYCSNSLLYMVYTVAGAQAVDQVAGVQVVVNQVGGTQVVDKVAGAQVMDQVAAVPVVVNQVAGAQVLDQVGRAQVLDQVT